MVSQRRMKLPEALRDAYDAALRAGWVVTRTGGRHLKWTPPEGEFIITSSTPSSGRRAASNSLAQLRRAGLKC